MPRVMSRDGTSIAYDRQGAGPPVILVGGGLDDGSENAPLATELADRFTVYNYARRGRGESGDTSPYAVQRELEDLEALLGLAGGSAGVYGVSSGGMFALEAAATGLAIRRLAVYEVPYDTTAEAAQRNRAYREQLESLLARVAGATRSSCSCGWPAPPTRTSPALAAPRTGAGLEKLAHTLAYDAACYGPPPVDRLATITRPTLVLTGGGAEFFELAADAVAAAMPSAERVVLEGQGHVADRKAVATALERFLNAGD